MCEMTFRNRVLRLAFVPASLVAFAATGCAGEPVIQQQDSVTQHPQPAFTNEDDPPPAPPAPVEPTPPVVTPPDPPAPPVPSNIKPAVVHVYQRDALGGGWYCTGTLVSADTVVTAAHCIDPTVMVSYTIFAENAPGAPRVSAGAPRIFGGTFDDPANPDLGTLTLSTPIALDTYAELVDVTATVASGVTVQGIGIVRTTEDPESSFMETAPMTVTSAVQYGYDHGIAVPMFSKAGDSGSGLFLVENGVLTNKLIGVARNPEQERGLDHYTRVDADLLAWMAAAPKP